MAEHCNWYQDGDETSDTWGTECGKMFTLYEGDPFENGMRHCCFCGKPLSVQRFLEPGEDGRLDWEEPRVMAGKEVALQGSETVQEKLESFGDDLDKEIERLKSVVRREEDDVEREKARTTLSEFRALRSELARVIRTL